MLNATGLFGDLGAVPSYLRRFKELVLSEADSAFVVFAIFDPAVPS